MQKSLHKYLIVTISSLCAISSVVDAEKVDVYISREDARENAEKFQERVRDQVPKYKKGERVYISQNSPGTISNIKDYVMDTFVPVGALAVGGIIGSELGRHMGGGDVRTATPLLCSIISGIISIPYAIRNWKRRWNEKETLKTEYCVGVTENAKVAVKWAQTEKRGKETGALSIG